MATKTFKLILKDGAEVKNLEELRTNFDLEKIAEYFKSGELVEWLENMFYEDEAEAIAAIKPGDDNFIAKICAALDVECEDDLEFTQRIREKKAILSEKTDDQTIIDNATNTALEQKDLADLLHMDYKKIYLCGEQFNVPIRMTDVTYVGILCTPKIKIKATSDEDLEEKNIKFENCKLPWTKESPVEQMKALFKKIFYSDGEWAIVNNGIKLSNYNQLDKLEKSVALQMVCQGKYTEDQIIYMQLTKDLSSGFALTIDAFCTGGAVSNKIFKYKDINRVDFLLNRDYEASCGIQIDHYSYRTGPCGGSYLGADDESVKKLFGDDKNFYERLKKFLDIAKNF